ncbi:isoprenylcysteine carboxyl methyltransferase [Venturia nashicola]|uniref:Protein-S-isoprenylcysteine O-methyltransferase n=1 Tax=Venturia nashicola TaxID=86259 RepID=A0A4Z1P8C0_9PEZI|nr:isoprenylcysteine carboxyl methyltransferase [Venturia nashicola]TLD37660.1 isoprenylcysteine carboxyl methyltransferase [Venturia nashicola]
MATISNPTLVLANLVAAYYTAVSMTPPNPPPAKQEPESITFFAPRSYRQHKLGILPWISPILSQTYLVAKGVGTPSAPSSLTFFPNLYNVNPKFVTWNRYSATCLGLIGLSGMLRLYAFRSLGKDFTFELAKPQKLKQDGIYKYLQHPSYPPLFIILVTNAAYCLAPDGFLGSFLPREVVEKLVPWKAWLWAGWALFWANMVRKRVRDEEKMLKETFGQEWEEWHAKTARFIPWIF